MKNSDWLISLFAAAVFLILSSWYISLPGLQYDECLCAAPAVNFVVENPKSEPTQINPSVVHIFGKPFPIMLMTYIGPIKTLLYIPFFLIFDISVFTVRLVPIIIMFLCFPIAFYLCKKLFNQKIAIFVVLLMSVDPSIVFYLTRDVGPATLQVFFKLFALMFVIMWWEKKKNLFLYITAIILGLGISHKVDFMWIIVGIVIPIIILYFNEIKKRINFKLVLFSSFYFAIGASPIIMFNLYTGGYTFFPLIQKFISNTHINNSSFFDNLLIRINQIIEIHNGNFISTLFCERNVFENYWKYFHSIILLISLIVVLLNLFRKNRPEKFSNMIAILLFIIIVTIETCFSPTVLSGHHLLALTPFITVLIVYTILSSQFFKRIFNYLILLAIFIYLLYSSIEINRILKDTGGTGNWSNSIYELNNYLQFQNKPVGVLDWGYTNNLIVLSKSNLSIDRIYTIVWKTVNMRNDIKNKLNDSTLYLIHTDRYTTFPVVKHVFFEIAAEAGYNVILEKEFYQGNGEAVHRVYRLKRI